MMSKPRTPNNEPSTMATMGLELELELGDGVAVSVEGATRGKVEVGDKEEDVEDVTFVTVV